MGSTTIESLELQIKADSTSAAQALDALAASLEKIKSATQGTASIGAVANQVGRLGVAVNSINGTAASNLSRLFDSLSKIKTLGDVKLSSSLANQISAISDASKKAQGLDFSGITNLGTALQGLGNIGKNNLGSLFNQLERIPTLTANIHPTMNTFIDDMKRLSEAMIPLASQMNTIGTAFSKLPQKMNGLVSASNKASGGLNNYAKAARNVAPANFTMVKSFTDVYTSLKATINTMAFLVDKIAGFIKESNSYIENLNLFTASMGEYAGEAKEYAEAVGEALGIDPGEWMRNQGVFNTIISGFGVASDRAYLMSKNLTQLGYDISSFFNISFAESMQKLQSGISGELEPLRRLGYDLSQARLQQEAYDMGLDKSIAKMTQAEKSQLRYVAIMKQVVTSHGDMARTIKAPANQLRVLQAQFTQCARAIGNIFIPALNAILPVVITAMKAIRGLADFIASIFGFELPEVDYSSLETAAGAMGDISDSADDASGGLGAAAKKAKELKNAILGIDELNVISPLEDTQGSGGGGGGAGGGDDFAFDFELPEYDFLKGLDFSADIDTDKLWDLAKVLGVLAGIKLGNDLFNFLKGLSRFENLKLGWLDRLMFIAGVIMAIAGAIEYFQGIWGILKDGTDWEDVARIAAGIAGVMGGLWLAIKPFLGVAWANLVSGLAGMVMGLGALAVIGQDIRRNGATWENLVGTFVALGAAIGGAVLAAKGLSSLSMMTGISATLTGVLSTLSKLMVPITALVGGLMGFSSFMADIITRGPSAQNVLGAIATGIIAVAGAIKAVMIAFELDPILGIVAAVAAAIGAIIAIGTAIKDAGVEAYRQTESFERMNAIIEESAALSEATTTRMQGLRDGIQGMQDISADFAAASYLVDEIYRISDSSEKTSLDIQKMHQLVETLNGLGLEGIQLSFDETGTHIIQAKEEVTKLISELERSIALEAMREQLVAIAKEQYNLALDKAKATKNQTEAEVELNAAQKEFSEYGGAALEVLLNQTDAVPLLGSKFFELEEAVRTSQEAFDTASESLQNIDSSIVEADEMMKVLTEALVTASDTTKEFSTQNVIDQIANIGKSVSDSNLPEAGANLIKGLSDGINNNASLATDAIGNAATSINDTFTQLEGIHSPSTVYSDYGLNIDQGLADGITNNASVVTDSLSTLTKEMASAFEGQSLAKNFEEAGKSVVEGFNKAIKSGESGTKSALQNLAKTAKSAFTDGDKINKNTFQKIGKEAVDGFNSAINSNKGTSQSPMQQWAKTIKDSFTNGTNINKNTFSNTAKEAVTGFNSGINAQYNTSTTPMKKWAETAKKAFTDVMNKKAFQDIAKEVMDGFNTSLTSSSSNTQMQTWANNTKRAFTDIMNKTAFQGVAKDIIDGFNSGINSYYSTTLPYMRTWANEAKAAYKRAVDSNSPSKDYMKIAGDVVSGFNIGIKDNMSSTDAVMKKWADQSMQSFTMDTSALDYYQSPNFQKSINAQVQSNYNATVTADSMEDALVRAYQKTMMPTMDRMAADMKRQADKNEQVRVQVGSKTIMAAVQEQQRANGYTFIREQKA